MIEQWLAALEQFELLRSDTERDELTSSVLSDEDIADALWLAAQMGGTVPTPEEATTETGTTDNSPSDTTGNSPSDTTVTPPPTVPSPPTVSAYPQNAQPQTNEVGEALPDTGLPINIQTAPALQNARGIGRALRPLMRKAPSRVAQVFDESATVDRIAKEEIWFPVLKPTRERWFDLELVVEEGPLSFVWEASLAEFQQVLQRQGAFRHIRTWQVSPSTTGDPQLRSLPINAPEKQSNAERTAHAKALPLRSPKELIDASKRGLVMYVSDCRSQLWLSGSIHKWLKLWGQHGPVTLVQLLPERLWQQTALKAGFKVQVSAFSRGVANTKLRRFNVPLRYRENAASMLTLPAITLTEEAISQWAQVVMAAGQQRLPARLFDTVWVEKTGEKTARSQDEAWAVIEPETPEDRLELFEATTSAPAQRLARLMSVVPVELPVVHIIQLAFFKETASPVHVAEVYNSCLIKQLKEADGQATKDEPKYEFEAGVRSLLNQQNLMDESFDVLDVVSQEIARSLGFEITSFTALLLPDIGGSEQAQAAILPFAQIATDVLYRLGGQYAELAVQVDGEVVARNRPTEPVKGVEPAEEFEIPPLKILEFYRAEVREEAPPVQLVVDEFTVATVETITELTQRPVRIFFSYSVKDKNICNRIFEHLKPLERQGTVELWRDLDSLTPGDELEPQIRQRLNDADIILLLISAYFADSDYCYNMEMPIALELAATDRVAVIPIIIRPVDWEDPPFSHLRVLPENGQPITTWAVEADALTSVAKGIDEVVTALLQVREENEQGRVADEADSAESLVLNLFEFGVANLVPAKAGWEVYREPQSAYQFVEVLGEEALLEMVAIPGGSFLMGSPENEPKRQSSEGPQHEVTVESFLMGKYPVTQAQWRFVAGLEQINRELNPDPSRFKGVDRPVEQVSWYEAVEFCARLSRYTGNEYNLPSEAQWEYACRAGTQSPFYFGDTLSSELASYRGTTVYNGGPQGERSGETTSVAYFDAANAFGLSDMHGNVWEWCADHWHDNYEGAPMDGIAWITENERSNRVSRGGSWSDLPQLCRSASRFFIRPDDRYVIIGFRVYCLAPMTLQPPAD